MSLQPLIDVLAAKRGEVIRLSALAKQAGYKSIDDPLFKSSILQLIKKGIIKIVQSGWRSEKRGTKLHEKVVILKAVVWEITPERSENTEASENDTFQRTLERQSIQTFIKGRPCVDCTQFEEQGEIGLCIKYGWEITKELAEKQTLCYYGKEPKRRRKQKNKKDNLLNNDSCPSTNCEYCSESCKKE